MLKIYFFISACFFTTPLFSQTIIIAKQSFESSGDTWIPISFSTTPCTIGIDSWNYHTTLGIINPNDGFQFWGVRDLNGDCGNSGFEYISLSNIDVSAYRNVVLSLDYNVYQFDNGDDIKYELFFDDISQGEFFIVEGTSNFSTNGWLTETINIPNLVNTIKIIVSVKQNGDADYAGIDNIKLEGIPLLTCSELIISEYIEGTSSINHRNSFIELYNTTNQILNLNNYDLVKYTSDNLNLSGTLELSGFILAYGTFLVEDITENIGIDADLSTNNTVLDFTGDDKIALRKSEIIIDIIGEIGDDEDFAQDITLRRKSYIQNPNNQFDEAEWDIYGLEEINNINSHTSSCNGTIPEIEIYANSNEIIDGSVTSDYRNNTYFGVIDPTSNNEISKSYFIKNTGSALLEINNIGINGTHASEFLIEGINQSNINPNDSLEIQIAFKPTSTGIKTAQINIENNDASENPFNFIIQGEGSGSTNSPIMITQYYEGNGNNKWLEITNISTFETPANTYYLGLYRNSDAKNPIGVKPSINKLIPNLKSGETLKYSASLNVNLPAYAIDGNEIKTNICTFDGNDIIIISTTTDKTCWENKLDIIGNSDNWGSEKSYIRKYGCETAKPNSGFNVNDWIEYEISAINSTAIGFNSRIGEHHIGKTTFDNTNNWNNGLPDEYRNITLDNDYDTLLYGNIDACNLTINSDRTLIINSDNYLSVQNDIIVNGNLNVLHQGSLHMANNSGNISNNGTISIHKTTTSIKKYDYTYWSTPVKNAILEDVFVASPQNSFYEFKTQNFIDSDNDGFDDDQNAWQRATKIMEIGKGYTAMAPNTTPFIDTQSVIFSGEVNNGLITTPVLLSDDNNNEFDDWNLIGNPYPSAIDTEIFINNANNQNILNGSLYFWTHNTSPVTDENGQKYSSDDYAMYTVGTGGIAANSQGIAPTQFIASGQGFFVEAKQSGVIEFNNEMRTKSDNDNFYKNIFDKEQFIQTSSENTEKSKDKIWINLFNDEGAFSQILIGFIEGANSSFESKFDGLRFDGNDYISFYSIVGNQHLAIQGTSSLKGDELISLGFKSKINEEITLKIGIDHLEGAITGYDIYLYDKELEKIQNLKLGEYTFSLNDGGLFNDRFYLKFNNELKIEKVNLNNDKLILTNEHEILHVKTAKHSLISSLIIYDILGRTIKQIKINQIETSIDISPLGMKGVYFIRAKLTDSRVLIKKFVHY